jgi:molybdopterin converting factor small subunit
MNVSVRLLGPFRRYSDRTVVELTLAGPVDVLAALQTLGDQLGDAFQTEVLAHLEDVKPLVLLNHKNLPDDLWRTVLADGDTLSLVPPLGGG